MAKKEKEPEDVSGPYESLLYWVKNLRRVATGKTDEDHLRWSTQFVVQRGLPATFASDALGAAGEEALNLSLKCKTCHATAHEVAQSTLDLYTDNSSGRTKKRRAKTH